MDFVLHHEKREGPWGGGNQFLKALESQLKGIDSAATNGVTSRILVVNSHHFRPFFRHLRAGIIRGDKVIHRVDGPISSTRRTVQGLLSDLRIYLFSTMVSDGVVFQSGWSKHESKRFGFKPKQNVVIHNAPDPSIFYPSGSGNRESSRRTRVIVTSWSTNPLKGFDLLEEIAALLIEEGFEFLFVGNSPRILKNFVHSPPMASEPLAAQLRSCDLYLSTSKNDSCSNSLLEAIHCGLVPVVINSGGNPEIVGVRELVFETAGDAASILREDLATLRGYARKINPKTLPEVTKQYVDFASQINFFATPKHRRLTFEVFVALDYLSRFVGWIASSVSRLRVPSMSLSL